MEEDTSHIIDDILTEVHYWRSRGLTEEEIGAGLESMFGSLVDKAGLGFGQTIKKEIVRWLLAKIGINPNTWTAVVFENAFASLNFADYGKVFTDCSFTTGLLAKSIIASFIDKWRYEKGFNNMFLVFLQQTVVESVADSDIVNKLEEKINPVICPILSKGFGVFKDVISGASKAL
jgi:hypothetical protein